MNWKGKDHEDRIPSSRQSMLGYILTHTGDVQKMDLWQFWVLTKGNLTSVNVEVMDMKTAHIHNFLTYYVFGSCFTTLAVIFVSDLKK